MTMTAHRIHRRDGGGIQACWRRRPAGRGAIGGDWIDAFRLDDGRLAVTIGDAAGHDAVTWR
ncbi:hypothetical protein BCD48_35290 [Pseudofrankia sp. BMG5.36]|nr:hypothetical protein BCD48_35290 [Pseudofrankia sp. BMG5.36]